MQSKSYHLLLNPVQINESKLNSDLEFLSGNDLVDRMMNCLEQDECDHTRRDSCANCAKRRATILFCEMKKHRSRLRIRVTYHKETTSDEIPTKSEIKCESVKSVESDENKFLVETYSKHSFLHHIPAERSTQRKNFKYLQDRKTSGMDDIGIRSRVMTIFDV
jgi:hypothetical protein